MHVGVQAVAAACGARMVVLRWAAYSVLLAWCAAGALAVVLRGV